jgi:hypothetical protein
MSVQVFDGKRVWTVSAEYLRQMGSAGVYSRFRPVPVAPVRKRLAPRWQLPAIKRRKAGVARAYRALAEQHNANVLKCADMRWGRV